MRPTDNAPARPPARDFSHLELEDRPDDRGAPIPVESNDRRSLQTRHRVRAYVIGALFVLAALAVALRYALPASGEPASRGALTAVENAVSAARSKAGLLWDGAWQALQAALQTQAQRKAQRDAQQKAHAHEAESKEAAWQRFFQRSAKCTVEENQTSVDCVNEYIRAKREFDRRRAAGEL